METEIMHRQERINRRSGSASSGFLPASVFRFLLILPLVFAFILAFSVAWPLWVWDRLHRKKDYTG